MLPTMQFNRSLKDEANSPHQGVGSNFLITRMDSSRYIWKGILEKTKEAAGHAVDTVENCYEKVIHHTPDEKAARAAQYPEDQHNLGDRNQFPLHQQID